MTRSQIRLAGFLLGLAGLGSALAPDHGRAAQNELVVVDGTGAVIGPVVPGPDDNAQLLWVVHPIAGVPVKLLVSENGPWDTKTRQPLLYESTDCSGTATIDVPGDPQAARDAVIFATVVFWPEGVGTDRTIRSAAWLVRNPEDCTAALVADTVCCAALPKPQVLRTAPASGVALASLSLSTPFRVEPARP